MENEETNAGEVTTEENQVVEAPVTEATQVEDSDEHPTKLGRKVKALAEDFTSVKSSIDEIKEMMAGIRPTVDASKFKYGDVQNPLDAVDDDDFITAKDMKRMIREYNDFQKQSEDKYTNDYAKTLSKVASSRGLDQDEYKAIEKELLDNHYGSNKSGNAAIDATSQWNAAEASYLRKQSAGGKISTVKGGTGTNPPLGVGGSETRTSNSVNSVKITPETAALMRALGRDPSDPKQVEWYQKTQAKK